MNVESYLREVTERIFGPRANVSRLQEDLRARFEEGLSRGESTASIVEHLGTPEEVAAAFMEDVEFDFAGLFQRLFAFAADIGVWVLIAFPFVALLALVMPSLEGHASWLGVVAVASAATLALSFLGILIFYFPLLESHFGATPGKRLMGLEVRSESGARIGLGAGFLRRLSFYFEILVLDSLFVPFTQKKQRAFDIVAKTVVLRDPDAPAGASRFLLCLAAFVVPIALMIVFCLLLGFAG